MTGRGQILRGIVVVMGVLTTGWAGTPLMGGEVDRALSLSWDKNLLTIHGRHLPGGTVVVWYIEAFCRPDSSHRAWNETVSISSS